jgi:hypothetical protein
MTHTVQIHVLNPGLVWKGESHQQTVYEACKSLVGQCGRDERNVTLCLSKTNMMYCVHVVSREFSFRIPIPRLMPPSFNTTTVTSEEGEY